MAPIVLTTHDMTEAERLCDRIAVIDRGAFVALDTASGLPGGRRSGDANPGGSVLCLTGRQLEEEEEG